MCESVQGFEPELATGRNAVRFFSECNREEAAGQVMVPAQLGGNPQQESRLPAASRTDHQHVRVRWSRASAHGLDHGAELWATDPKTIHQLIVREEPGVVFLCRHFSDTTYRSPELRTAGGTNGAA